MYVRHCVIKDGMHTGPPGCSHTRSSDETGPIPPWGWTSQHDLSEADFTTPIEEDTVTDVV